MSNVVFRDINLTRRNIPPRPALPQTSLRDEDWMAPVIGRTPTELLTTVSVLLRNRL